MPPAGFEPAFPPEGQPNLLQRKLDELTAGSRSLDEDLKARIPKPERERTSMARGLNYEKANWRERHGQALSGPYKKRKTTGQKRQWRRHEALQAFVDKHRLACFKCGQGGHRDWAKTGINKRGPWAICVGCVDTNKTGGRAAGNNPRAQGTNPRALGTNPRKRGAA
jgi:hypothetical protein